MADKTVVTSAFWGKEQNTNVTISVLQPESKSVLGIDQPLADQKIVRYRYTERRQDRCRYLFRLKNKTVNIRYPAPHHSLSICSALSLDSIFPRQIITINIGVATRNNYGVFSSVGFSINMFFVIQFFSLSPQINPKICIFSYQKYHFSSAIILPISQIIFPIIQFICHQLRTLFM